MLYLRMSFSMFGDEKMNKLNIVSIIMNEWTFPSYVISFILGIQERRSEGEQPAGYYKQQYSLSLSEEPIFLLLFPFVIGWNEKLNRRLKIVIYLFPWKQIWLSSTKSNFRFVISSIFNRIKDLLNHENREKINLLNY